MQSSNQRFAQRIASVRPSAIREILKVTQRPEVISFAGGLPAPEHFPTATLGALASEVLASIGSTALQYSLTEGVPELRAWVAERMQGVWGIPTTPDDVLITGGSQQGLDLVAKAYLDPGDLVALEAPSYLGAIQAFDTYQARYLTIETDGDGLIPEALERSLSQLSVQPKLLYLIPNFQNPSGTTLSAERREAIVRICEQFEIPIFEDDPYGELRFAGTPQRPLASFSSRSPIFYAGTGSKVMAPGLRVAWLLLRDPAIRAQVVPLKQASDLHTGTLAQYLFHRFVADESRFSEHLHTISSLYGTRQHAMVSGLRATFGSDIEFTIPEGGMFLWATLRGIDNTAALFPYAQERNVVFVPGEFFYANAKQHNGMRLSFSNTDETKITEGLTRLQAAVNAYHQAS